MPWQPADAVKHSKAAKSDKQKRAWSEAANAARKKALDEGKSPEEADAIGVRIGNAAVSRVKEEALAQHGRFREYRAATLQDSARRVEIDEKGENGVIHDVLILGTDSRGMGVYSPNVQQAAVALYDGAPTYVNHTKDGSNPDYLKKLGVHRNPRATPEGIRTDFHFNAKHSAASQLIWDARNAPNTLGFSHDADCTFHRESGKRIVDSIDKVYGVDLVSRAGTTRGLFEDEEVIEGDEAMQSLAVSSLSAMDNARAILFAEDTDTDAKRERLIEALVQWQGDLREGEISDEILDQENRRKLRKINDTANDMLCRAMWDDEQYPTIASKKARCLAVLADWETELHALAGTAMQEESTMGTDYKDITVEELTKQRPDLVAVLQGTDEKSRLTEEVASLKAAATAKDAELATLKEEKAKRLREEEIAAELKAASFPTGDEVAYSLRFREQLAAAPDKAARAVLIEDRMALVKTRLQEQQTTTPSPMAELRPQQAGETRANKSYDYLFGAAQ